MKWVETITLRAPGNINRELVHEVLLQRPFNLSRFPRPILLTFSWKF